MLSLIFSVTLGVALQQESPSNMQIPNLDGEWAVVTLSQDGKAINKGASKVTIRNNVVMCNHDGKEMAWKLEFGANNIVRSTEVKGSKEASTTGTAATEKSSYTHQGVYIATSDVLCLSFNKSKEAGTAIKDRTTQVDQASAQDRWQAQRPVGSEMVIVLRKAGSAGDSRTDR